MAVSFLTQFGSVGGGAIGKLLVTGVIGLLLMPNSASAADALQFFKNYFVTGDYAVAGAGMERKGVADPATQTFIVQNAPKALNVASYHSSFSRATLAAPALPNNPDGSPADIVAAFLYWQTTEAAAAPSSALGTIRSTSQAGATAQLVIGKKIGADQRSPCWGSGGSTGLTTTGPVLRTYRADVYRNLPAVNGKRQVTGSFEVKLPDSGTAATPTILTKGVSLVVVYRVRSLATPLKAVVLYDGAFTMDASSPVFTQLIRGFYQPSTTGVSARLTHIAGDGQPNFKEELLLSGNSGGKTFTTQNPFIGALGASWDNPTFDVSASVSGKDTALTTTVRKSNGNGFDCLSWGAVVFSTTVQDTDNDGLLDNWERDDVYLPVLSNNTDGYPVRLPMADPLKKDIYVEVGFMKGDDGHSHLPKLQALDMVYQAFRKAQIEVHFDVGNNYQTNPPRPFIVPTSHAEGGHLFNETACNPARVKDRVCEFPGVAGVISWKTGFQVLRDRSFEPSRRNSYHYALFAHALAVPTAPGSGIPKSTSGVGESGGDFAITLGLWRADDAPNCLKDPAAPNTSTPPLPLCSDRVGTTLVQAGTLMHELGHNLGLNHGGADRLPNCKPNYQSVMNYLFQVRGLVQDPLNPAAATVDFSDRQLPSFSETNLNEALGIGVPPATALPKYTTRWFAPLIPGSIDALLNSAGTRTAVRHCDGTDITDAAQVIRVDGTTVGGPVDWNNNGQANSGYAQDVNFNGPPLDPVFTGYNDWANVDLRQVSARGSMLGMSGGIRVGDLSTADPVNGSLDLGSLDLGSLDLGSLDLGSLDLGSLDLGSLPFGSLDLGSLDLGEVEFETAAAVVDPPSGLSGVMVGIESLQLTWTPPAFGVIRKYGIWRMPDAAGRAQFGLVGTVSGMPPQTTFTDTELRKGVQYTYFVTSYDEAEKQSGASNKFPFKR